MDKSKQNSKKCSISPQEGRNKETEKQKTNRPNRKQK